MEEPFKKLSEVTKPDPRSNAFVVYDEKLNDFREKELSDIYESLDQITLKDTVPDAIKTHFNTSKHLALYSWFVYRFIPVAEFHAIASLEYALKVKTGKERWGLRKLLQYAVELGWVQDDDFSIHRWSVEQRKANAQELSQITGFTPDLEAIPAEGAYTRILVESLPYLRNVYAHGSSTIAPQGYLTLRICSEFINRLFPA